MSEKNGKSPLVAVSAMVALFAALGVIVYTQVPFKGVRPSVTVIPEPSQKIRARLWEDPFRAVMDQIKTKDQTRSFPAGRCICPTLIIGALPSGWPS